MTEGTLTDGVAVFEATMKRLDEAFTVSLLASRLDYGEGILSRKSSDSEIISAGQRNGFTSILLGETASDWSFAPAEVAFLDRKREDIQSRRLINSRDYVSADTPIIGALDCLANRYFLLVLKHSSVTSILTPADFNKLPLRTLLNTMLSRLENLLDGEIQTYCRDSDRDMWMNNLSADRRTKLDERLRWRKAADRELPALSCAYFSDKLFVAKKISSVREKLGTGAAELDADECEICMMRNQVAHGKDVVVGRYDRPESQRVKDKNVLASGISGFRNRVLRLRRWINALSLAT